jgi:hypothetical protein
MSLFEKDLNAKFLSQNPFFINNMALVKQYIPVHILKNYRTNILTKREHTNELLDEILNNVWLPTNKEPLLLRIKEIPLENWDISILTLAQKHLDWNVLSESKRIT